MALLHVSFFSKTLMRTIPLSVYLPSDAVDFNNQSAGATARSIRQ